MLLVRNIRLPLSCPDPDAEAAAQALHILRVPAHKAARCGVAKLSVDARHGKPVLVYTMAITLKDEGEESAYAGASPCVCFTQPARFSFSVGDTALKTRPVVVGLGPAGLFAALLLARSGFRPLVLERGPELDERVKAVEHFEKTGELNLNANIQFGEGGAGTFSDGKLTTRVGDPLCAFVTDAFLQHGAPADIAWRQKPHVGTDLLRGIIRSIRQEIIALGGEVRFNTALTGLKIENGALASVETTAGDFACEQLILAVGHSARDTFAMLHQAGVPMEQKPFAVGVRIEHPRALIDRSQYGRFAGHPALGAADYKLSCRPLGGRGVYTFCMCPGGVVMAAASEEGGLVVNGMSEHARDAVNSNSALLVGVGPEDFGSAHPLAGAAFQRKIEQAAFALGGGGYRAPIQLVADFLRDQKSASLGEVEPSYRPGVTFADLRDCLPAPVALSLKAALPAFGRQLAGFDRPDAVLTGVESRSSSPVRLLRDDSGQSAVHGLFPCGEGAGYAGGIVSAAVDGVRAAEQVMRSLLGGELPNPCG